MLRKTLLVLCLVALAVPAGAVTITSGTGTVTMNLTILGFAQVMVPPGADPCGNPFDEVINFSSDVAGGPCPDYYRFFGQVGADRGMYLPLIATDVWPNTGEKPTTDPWANGYYESQDGADYYMSTNGMSQIMTITCTNGLASGSTVLNTWFTLAASGPFTLNGVVLSDGTIPGDGLGSYFADEFPATDGALELGGTAFHPNQYPFPMVGGGTWTYTFNGVCSGSLKFLGRVERNNISDPAGAYTTTLNVTFTP